MLATAPYDVDGYPRIWECPQASIDRRHLFWMYDILCAGNFAKALEIGSLNGASSTAFVEAIDNGFLSQATFCDIDIRETLKAVLAHSQYPERITTFEGRSVELLQEENDIEFVFVDGDHRMATVREEIALLLKRKPVCFMAHDTNAQATGFEDCDGPPYLKWAFQTEPSYFCLEDNAFRSGEATHRGMFFATTSLDLFEAARQSLKTWGTIS